MPRRKGRKNPTPQRLPHGEGDQAEIFPDPNLKLPENPNEILKILRQTPITSLYRVNEMNGWESIVRTSDGVIECPRCEKQYSTWKGLHYHVTMSCPKYCHNRFTCLVCGKEFQEEAEIQAHVSVIHVRPPSYESSTRIRKATKPMSGFFSDDSADDQLADSLMNKESVKDEEFVVDESEYASPDEGRDASLDEDGEEKCSTRSGRYVRKGGKTKTKLGCPTFSFAKVGEPISEVMPWTFKFLSQLDNEFKEVHLELMPRRADYKSPLPLEEFIYCGGNVAPSPPFTIEREGLDDHTECGGLEPFTSLTPIDSHDRYDLTFCASGPVWAASWCPASVEKPGSKQYLAVSSHSELHSVSQCYSEPGIVQVWDCGRLGVHGHKNEAPRLVIGFSHYDGPIWDLKWCPLGGHLVTKDEEKIDRIGVLAAACGSGKVLVMAVPDPEKMSADESSSSSQKGNIYRAKPNLILLPSAKFFEVVEERQVDRAFGQCLSLDWSLADGCKWLVGGYANGIVALWKIHDPSPLLLQKSEFEPLSLVACRSFLAHNKAVRGVAWCPYKDNMFATGSMDRFLRVWDRDNPQAPIKESNWKGSMYLGLQWPLLWCGVYAATEEVFSGPSYHGAMYHDGLQDYLAPVAVIPFKSTCWSISSNPWMNLLAGCDPMGQTVIHACNNWSRKAQGKKSVPRIQLFSTSVEMIPVEVEAEDSPQDGNKEQNWAGYKLVFKDTDMTNLHGCEKRACCKSVKVFDNFPQITCEKPLFQSVNCVRWNPNLGSHTWVMSGTQSGLVRLHCINEMHSNSMDSAFRECAS